MQLRPYQEDAIASVMEAMRTEQNVLLQAPTAAGKTVIFTTLVKRLLRMAPKGRVLMLAHRQELIGQAAEKMRSVWPHHPRISIACAGKDKRVVVHGSIVFGSVQTMARRLDDLMPFNLCIIDEAHRLPPADARHTQYITLLEALRLQNPEMRLLGVTATPYRLGHGYIYGDQCREGAVNIFPRLHHQIEVKELLEQGYLSPMRGKVSLQENLLSDLGSVKVNGDYAEGELGEVMSKPIYIDACVDLYERHAADRNHVMVFACTISHAEKIRDAFAARGHHAEVVHSQTNKLDRAAILAGFVDGNIKVLVNVSVLIEGFDAPRTDCIIMARPTKSAALYVQQAGRGLRLAEGKTDCLLLDISGNTIVFGADFDNIRVAIPKVSDEPGEAPAKACPECESLVHCSAHECPECGYVFPPPPVEERPAPEILTDVDYNVVPEAVDAEIISATIEPYTSRAQNSMLRLTLETNSSMGNVYHYLNFDQDAHWYQRQKSGTWWRMIHGWDDEPPETNEQAAFLCREDLLVGMAIKLKEDGKFVKVVGW